jgi:hypothetical protein
MPTFDWYQATIPRPCDDVLEALMPLEDGAELAHAKGIQGYAYTTRIEGHRGTVASVWHGGSHPHPHVVITGEMAQAGADCIRVAFPLHKVTRVDAKEDFGDAEAFDRITPHLVEVARARRVKLDTRGDHLLTMQGRSVYLGSPKSAAMLRLYDKAAELRHKYQADPVRLAEIPQNLTRLEAQVRPQTAEARLRFASIEPIEVLGSAKWLRELWLLVAGQELTPVQVEKGYRQSDHERARAFILAQYGNWLRREFADLGSWAAVGAQLGYDLDKRQEAELEARKVADLAKRFQAAAGGR